MKKLIFLFLSILFSFSIIGQRDSTTTLLRTYRDIDTANLTPPYNKVLTVYKSNAEGQVTTIDTTDMTVSGYINMLIAQAQADSVVYRINRESFYSAYQEASTNYLNNSRYLQKLHAVAGNVFELPTVGVRGVAEGGTEGQVLKKASSDDFDTEWVSEPLVYKANVVYSSGTLVVDIIYNTLGFTPSWELFDGSTWGFNFPYTPDYSKLWVNSSANNEQISHIWTNGDYHVQFDYYTSGNSFSIEINYKP